MECCDISSVMPILSCHPGTAALPQGTSLWQSQGRSHTSQCLWSGLPCWVLHRTSSTMEHGLSPLLFQTPGAHSTTLSHTCIACGGCWATGCTNKVTFCRYHFGLALCAAAAQALPLSTLPPIRPSCEVHQRSVQPSFLKACFSFLCSSISGS